MLSAMVWAGLASRPLLAFPYVIASYLSPDLARPAEAAPVPSGMVALVEGISVLSERWSRMYNFFFNEKNKSHNGWY